MSDVFFADLSIPEPDVHLGVGSGKHAEQTAGIMVAFERALAEERPDMVLVYGDVNSTLACAVVCAERGVPVGHVQAGLRGGDRTMPEEINRLVTDSSGIQEETTALQIPCITLRTTTERPITVTLGTNEVIGTDSGATLAAHSRAVAGDWKAGIVPGRWDGHATDRIASHLTAMLDAAA